MLFIYTYIVMKSMEQYMGVLSTYITLCPETAS